LPITGAIPAPRNAVAASPSSLYGTFAQRFADNIADTCCDAHRVFEQQWANAILNRVLSRLQDWFVREQKNSAALFKDIQPAIIFEPTEDSYAEIAAKYRSTEAAIKMAVKRLRKRYGTFLELEIASTVSTPEEVKEELRALFAAVT